ncbi:MAG: flagellar biosynthetic protein FliQ [Phycisphaerae bacterium]|nr:flagellar biosynthetic protein FliQ [Phycisphaerae bacterium]
MSPDYAIDAIDLARQALILCLLIAGPILLVALLVGLVVGLLQAATGLSEQTVAFVPKLAAMALAGILLLPWMISRLVDFAARMFIWP